MFRLVLSLITIFALQATVAQNEASASRTEMIASRIDAGSYNSFTMQSFELNCFEKETPGDIKIFYAGNVVQKIIYSYFSNEKTGEISYYYFKGKLNYVDHSIYSFNANSEEESLKDASKKLESRNQLYFNGTEMVFEKNENWIKNKEVNKKDYLYFSAEMKRAAEERIKLLEKN